MTTLSDFEFFRIQIQVVNNALRFFSKGAYCLYRKPHHFCGLSFRSSANRRVRSCCASPALRPIERFILPRIVAQSCYKNRAILLPEITLSSGVPVHGVCPLKHDDSVLIIIIVVIKPAGSDDSVEICPQALTRRSEHFQSWTSVRWFQLLSRSVTPIVVIRAMRTGVSSEYSQNVTYTAVIYCSGANTSPDHRSRV